MDEDRDQLKDDGREQRQNPVVHEGAPPDPGGDSNERADDRAEIQQPSGEVVSPAEAPQPLDDSGD